MPPYDSMGGFYAPDDLVECLGCGEEFEPDDLWLDTCPKCGRDNEDDEGNISPVPI